MARKFTKQHLCSLLKLKNKMLSTELSNYSPEDIYYFKYMVIGLAPEGKFRVCIKNNGRPNLEQAGTEITTVYGKELDMCKRVTERDFSYGYDDDTIEFIKNTLRKLVTLTAVNSNDYYHSLITTPILFAKGIL